MTDKTPREKAEEIFETTTWVGWWLLKWYVIFHLTLGALTLIAVLLVLNFG